MSMCLFRVVAMLGMCLVVDNVQFAVLVIEAIPPFHISLTIFLFETEESIVPGKKSRKKFENVDIKLFPSI